MEPHIPRDRKNLRACLLCSLIKNQAQFKRDGCDNCEEILRMRDRVDRVTECTTTTFDGMISLMHPTQSWVGRWQRIDPYIPGLYAIRVTGRIPEDVEIELENRGMRYRPRNGSMLEM